VLLKLGVLVQLSLGVGAAHVAIAEHPPETAGKEMFDGQEIVGFSSSETETETEQVAEFPAASAAVKVTVVEPIGNAEPLAGEAVTVAPQLSELLDAE
jgi:hypothetical protein